MSHAASIRGSADSRGAVAEKAASPQGLGPKIPRRVYGMCRSALSWLGRRIKTEYYDGATTTVRQYVYLGGSVIRELDGSNNVLKGYVGCGYFSVALGRGGMGGVPLASCRLSRGHLAPALTPPKRKMLPGRV